MGKKNEERRKERFGEREEALKEENNWAKVIKNKKLEKEKRK